MITTANRADPILVVDFGTSSSSGILVADGRERVLKDPASGRPSWPSSVFHTDEGILVGEAAERAKRGDTVAYRDEIKREIGQSDPIRLGGVDYLPSDLAAAVLRAFRVAAHEISPYPVDRVLVTVPASYGPADPRRTATVAAATAAGFTDVELLSEPVAAAWAPVAGEAWYPGDLVLVYDFGGGTFDTALVRITTAGGEVLGHNALDNCGGRDVDAKLRKWISADAAEWLEPLLASGGAARQRLSLWIGDSVRELKHALASREHAEGYLLPTSPQPSRLTVDELRTLTEEQVESTVVCCRNLLEDARQAPADVTGVLMVGGSTRMPVVPEALARLGIELRRAEDVELAVVYGAAAWARGAGDRRFTPTPQTNRERPLRWSLPDDEAVLSRWLVPRGAAFPPGASLARVRLPNGALHDLTADQPGTVLDQHVSPGGVVTGADWAVTTLAPAGPADLLTQPVRLTSIAGAAKQVAVRPDGHAVAVGDETSIRVYSVPPHRLLHTVPVSARASGLAWSPDGTRLAHGRNGDTCDLNILTVATGAHRRVAVTEGAVHDLVFDRWGRYVLAGCGDGAVRAYDTVTRLTARTDALRGWVDTISLHPAGHLLAAAGEVDGHGVLVVLDLVGEISASSREFPTPVRVVRYAPDGRALAVAGGAVDGGAFAVLLDPTTLQHRHDLLAPHQRADQPVRSLAFSHDGRLVAVAGTDTVHLRDTDTAATVATVPADGVVSLAFSPDADLLFAATTDSVTYWAVTARGSVHYTEGDAGG